MWLQDDMLYIVWTMQEKDREGEKVDDGGKGKGRGVKIVTGLASVWT
jgi:hypothetical protein